METSQPPQDPQGHVSKAALLAAGVAAILASACCLGPLVLIAVGISGAWIGSLVALEPYQPAFVVVAFVALFVAGRRIWRPASADCSSEQWCSTPSVRRGYQLLFSLVAALILIALVFPLIAPRFY